MEVQNPVLSKKLHYLRVHTNIMLKYIQVPTTTHLDEILSTMELVYVDEKRDSVKTFHLKSSIW